MASLLVSTPLRLMVLDGSTITTIHEGKQEEGNGNYHGITWNEFALFVAGSQDYRYIVRVFTRKFSEVSILRNNLHQTHQILWAHGRLYVVNTGKNRVEIWDGRNWQWVAWNPSSCDLDHINGIWSDGETVWVSEYRHRSTKPSVVRMCEPDLTLKKTITIGPALHNVYVENGVLYNLIAGEFRGLLATDLATGEIQRHEVRGGENNWIRGLARTADRWYIGLSKWEAERGDRHKGDAVVVELDNDFQEVNRLVVPDAGPVCDVRVLNEPDLAHNGIEW